LKKLSKGLGSKRKRVTFAAALRERRRTLESLIYKGK